jgi:two-component system sensor histidine kinase/response regulator
MLKNEIPESKILIVDDNPKNLEILGKTLENQKHYVEFAVDGEAALEWVKNQMFDLILLDVMMPGMNGFEVCEQLRSNSKYDDIPVIFLTAETDKKNIVKGLELGAQDYVTKPFDTKELLARVSTQLELRHSREKLKSVNKWLEEKVNERTEQLKKANEELISLDNAKAEFLNIISHEIRTPLNGIVGPLQLLKGRSETGELSELINVLDISVTRLEKFSLAALTITNLRTKKHEIQKKPVVLEELIDNSLNELNEEIRQRNLRITKKTISGKQVISGKFDLLGMCITSILENAVRYSDNDGEIIIHTDTTDSEISCEISDKGPGFSEEALQKLFKLFAPGEQHINANIGLDLALVKMIVDAHNSRIEINNSPEGGATVKLTFKIWDSTPGE